MRGFVLAATLIATQLSPAEEVKQRCANEVPPPAWCVQAAPVSVQPPGDDIRNINRPTNARSDQSKGR